MLSNIMFSVNICLPIFFLLIMGFLLHRKDIINDEYVQRTTRLVFNFLLPGKLFADIAQTDLQAAFNGSYAAAAFTGCILQFAISWIIGDLVCREKEKQSAFSHAGFRGNFAYVGLALLQNIYGGPIPETVVITALVLTMYNILGTILMTVKMSRGSVNIRNIVVSILKNPMIIGIVAALPFAYFHVELPFVVTKSLSYMQDTAGPLALLAVGASLRPDALRGDIKLVVAAALNKLIVSPVVWLAACVIFGVTGRQLVVAVIAGCLPTAVNCYIVTKRMGGDGDLVTGAVVISHVLSIFTMPVIIFLLKMAGMI